MMTPEDLAAIRERAEKATPGPWERSGRDDSTTWIEAPSGDILIHDERGHGHMRESFAWIERSNAEFIAHAREDVPALLAEVERLTEERDMLKRGGAQLGRIIDRHVEWVLDATDMHDAIDENGDGDWELIWEELAALRPERDRLKAQVERLRESVALVTRERDEWEANEQERARELDALHSRLDKVRALAETDRRCPCCTGYESILQALDGSDQ